MLARTGRVLAPTENRLLAHLPPRDRRRFIALCDTVELQFGQVLADADVRFRYVYFPTTGFISLIAPVDRGATLEVALIGREGMLGATTALGVQAAPLRALVQGDGTALRMTSARFRRELRGSGVLCTALLRYCYVLMRQASQIAACTHYHPVEARLARWLLMTEDRTQGSALHLTHEFLSGMLGVRRVGVTLAAGALQARRLILYHRGSIVVVNRSGLEAASCKCYAADKRLYRRTLG